MADGNHVVAIVTFEVTPANTIAVTELLRTILLGDATTVSGFIEGRIMIDEPRTHVIIFTEWGSREAWAQAEWDERISRCVAEIYKETASYDIKLLFPVAEASAPSR